jgi:hypothetical protein
MWIKAGSGLRLMRGLALGNKHVLSFVDVL